ncbi:hypothetical protein [Nocardia asteroides]|uniref:hypothetical protein n=1 Tax=Nocardia asteroides TaxID=1824 RepID=UPI0033F1B3A4
MTTTLAPTPQASTVHQVTRKTPIYLGIGHDVSDMFIRTGRGAGGPFLARLSMPTDRPTGATLPVRILPGDILDIDGIGRYRVGDPGRLEPRLIPA